MRWQDIDFHPPSRTLRQFAAIWIVFFGGMALWQGFVLHRTALATVLAVATLLGPVGLMRPQWLRPIFVGWMVAVFPIGWVMSRLIMTFVFFTIFLPIALVFRMMGRDALRLKRRPDAATYWQPKPAPADLHSYFRQF
jgi:hypothetical protein